MVFERLFFFTVLVPVFTWNSDNYGNYSSGFILYNRLPLSLLAHGYKCVHKKSVIQLLNDWFDVLIYPRSTINVAIDCKSVSNRHYAKPELFTHCLSVFIYGHQTLHTKWLSPQDCPVWKWEWYGKLCAKRCMRARCQHICNKYKCPGDYSITMTDIMVKLAKYIFLGNDINQSENLNSLWKNCHDFMHRREF